MKSNFATELADMANLSSVASDLVPERWSLPDWSLACANSMNIVDRNSRTEKIRPLRLLLVAHSDDDLHGVNLPLSLLSRGGARGGMPRTHGVVGFRWRAMIII